MPCRSAAPSALSPPTGPRSKRGPTIIGTETYALFLRHGSLATHEDVNRFLALERAACRSPERIAYRRSARPWHPSGIIGVVIMLPKNYPRWRSDVAQP